MRTDIEDPLASRLALYTAMALTVVYIVRREMTRQMAHY